MGIFDFFKKSNWQKDPLSKGEKIFVEKNQTIDYKNFYPHKITISDGRFNPFLGIGYILTITGKFIEYIDEKSTISVMGNGFFSKIYQIDEIENLKDCKKSGNGEPFLSFIAYPGENIWEIIKAIKKSEELTITYRHPEEPHVGNRINFDIQGLEMGLKFFKTGYTKIV
tara:strand:- start:41 stop:547 length:507 start_codon:yes stop_codon:yes gene_type:complete